MPQLYVVRRTFKTNGEIFVQGTILDDVSDIKLARTKIREGKIVPLPSDESKLAKYVDYFQAKVGVDLKAGIQSKASKGLKKPEPAKPKVITPTPGTTTKSVVKPLSGKN